MMPKIVASIVAGCLAAFASTAATAKELSLAGGPIGGGWYLIGGGIAEIVKSHNPDISIKVVPGGAMVNPPRVGTGEVDLGFSLLVPTNMAIRGEAPFDQKYKKLRAVAFGFSVTYFQVVALDNVPIDSVEEIFEKKYPAKITTPGLQTLGGWTVRSVLSVLGKSVDDIKAIGGVHFQADHAQQADLLRNGQADILMTLLALPAPSLLEISTVRKLKFLTMSRGTLDKVVARHGYGRDIIPSETYKSIAINEDFEALTMPSGIIVNADVPGEIVYRLTKTLIENAERVQKIHPSMSTFVASEVARAVNRGGIPLHPGAERYYKEEGIGF